MTQTFWNVVLKIQNNSPYITNMFGTFHTTVFQHKHFWFAFTVNNWIDFSALGIDVIRLDWKDMDFSNRDISGILIQYPDTDGHVHDYMELVDNAHANGVSSHLLGGQHPPRLMYMRSVHNILLSFHGMLHTIASCIFSRPSWPVPLTFWHWPCCVPRGSLG